MRFASCPISFRCINLLFSRLVAGILAGVAAVTAVEAADLDWRAEDAAKLDGLSDLGLNRETGQVFAVADGKRYSLSMKDGCYVLSPMPAAGKAKIDADPIPDGRIAFGAGEIAAAWLSEPTLRYRHGVLGDNVEAEALKVRLRNGRTLTHTLPDDSVYEDLEPRIIDLDGEEAVLVARSYLDSGAAIAVYRIAENKIQPVGEAYPIGLSHRWLNPVGAADFDGDGLTEVAAVVTPHLSGILTMYQLDGDVFRKDAARSGYSTHFIGSTVLAMSVVLDANSDGVPDIVLPSLDRGRLAVVTFAGGSSSELLSLPQPSRIVTSIVAADLDGNGVSDIIFGRDDGVLLVIHR